eukprot:754662-Hanusia_phi.AAC.1
MIGARPPEVTASPKWRTLTGGPGCLSTELDETRRSAEASEPPGPAGRHVIQIQRPYWQPGPKGRSLSKLSGCRLSSWHTGPGGP